MDERDPALVLSDALGGQWVAGLDEVGRGPLAGPVVAAAVVLDPERPIAGLGDSKKLSEKRREVMAKTIEADALAYAVAFVEAERIDAINILQASLAAMAEAFAGCEAKLGRPIAGAVVDGKVAAPLPARVRQETLIGGDGRSQPIMAASILAKVARDHRMLEEAKRFPGYGFERHKGYPTKAHREALVALGPCAIHRRSFAPVAAVIAERGAARPSA